MKKSTKALLGSTLLIVVISLFGCLVLDSSMILRVSFSTPETSYRSWEEILSNPKPITIHPYSTGTMQTDLSGILNLEHELASDIEDVIVEIPVIVSIIHHQELGAYLIDAGLDSSYTNNPYGTTKGLLRKYLGKGSQEPNTHVAAILEKEKIKLQGVWLTHLHPDHIAGIVDLHKDIPYVAGKDERYINFRFFLQSDHLAGLDVLYEIEFDEGVDLHPFGKGVDLLGDGSLWAIESSGHSKGHVMYFINGVKESVLVTGDACNDQFQHDSGIGPGYFRVIWSWRKKC